MIYLKCDEKRLMKIANRAVTNKESFTMNIFGWRTRIFKITLPLFFKHKKSDAPNWISKLEFWFFLFLTPFTWVSITYADLAGYEISYKEKGDEIVLIALAPVGNK